MTTVAPLTSTQECAAGFEIGIDWAGRQVTVRGPLDSTTAALFVEAVHVLLRTSPGPITVELRTVNRLTAAGMLALHEACRRQNRSGSTIALKLSDQLALDLVRNGYGKLIGQPTWQPGAARPASDNHTSKIRI